MNILLKWSSVLSLFISFFSLADETRLSAQSLLNEITTDFQQDIAEENISVIRFKIATSRIVKAVVLWDKEGNILFPIKGGLPYVSDDLILRDISRFDLLLAVANPVKWEQRDTKAFIFHYCRKNVSSSCLIIDGIELSEQLDVKPEEFSNAVLGNSTLSIKNYLIPSFILLILICLFYIFYQKRIPIKEVVDTGYFTLGDLTVKPKQQIGIRDSLTISLTSRDIKLLTYMASHSSEVMSKDQLYSAGWGRDFLPNSRALEQHIMVLRRKLDPDKTRQVLIETIHGQGYKCP
jgi:hypothetical protein